MKRRKKPLIILGTVTAVLAVGYFGYFYHMNNIRSKTVQVDLTELASGHTPLIARDTPAFADWKRGEGVQNTLPKKDHNLGIDIRSMNISQVNLTESLKNYGQLTFDSRTVWPEILPDGFDPDQLMELGMNPGLGIRKLHSRGITGQGVGIAIIDQGLLADHEQYKDNLAVYEQYQSTYDGATMHGAAVASIAAGKDVGVAPGATLYYIANTFYKIYPPFGWADFNSLAGAIERVLEINEVLPDEEKIRVISVSRGFSLEDSTQEKYVKEMKDVIDKAKGKGVFVITTSTENNFACSLMGLGREALADPDDVNSYVPGAFWADYYYANSEHDFYSNMLLVPMDARATATFTGAEDYVYYATGGLSWSVPWMAGMYALCVQVKPDITPDIFIRQALETGDTIPVEKDGKIYQLGTIINPERLVESILLITDK